MAFAKMVLQAAQKSSKTFSSQVSAITKNRTITSDDKNAEGWTQTIGMRPGQQDFGLYEQWDTAGLYSLDHTGSLNKAFTKGHQAIQGFFRSGTVAAGMLRTEKETSLFSCGDCSVALFFPQSPNSDGSPILIPPARSEDVVIGKDGSRLKVGGHVAIENEENFPTVKPTPIIKTLSNDQLKEYSKEHGAAMIIAASDGARGYYEDDVDFEELYRLMQDKDAKDPVKHSRQQLLRQAEKAFKNDKIPTDNQTMFFDYLPDADKVTFLLLCDGHGQEGDKVARTVAKQASSIIESSIKVLYRADGKENSR
ncbi:MAG: hypothetical protein PQ612_02575 [Rickettsiales bacterium]|nr:hypothetical protein [Pseudomonadota bacterium]MDA0966002.1 hypothetical protein [Pseudomonadota bacterium]MDG4542527.1 hypothetical protein [Rickettsiales bacterium]MDG4545031.1 hypothetical protein [Rickettsiales bacterium]MDG4547154.1 hypothetical protein [Rickettsiales bacterium]